ncbi:hypothetical protein GYMLUDRAFT_243000 [Collybiopsis luxurians FD-317 M1]|uniref:Uncharacterized protein n=1 Tax=Collybiopsis luxurians FD-317 M1 TaxID=944289 RepID=A0A0D0CI53_9AGAR|nr:hypothetical protein GYMLUDRAFT_243000 [Collybiopsis luxurians FD-317 M1]
METSNALTISTNDSCDNLYHCRSLLQLIWSCVSVLVACTWVSVHPNVPAADESFWRTSGRKIALMTVTLIAPEVVVLWAVRQWFAARKLSKCKRWSISHGFFLIMGGFARYDEGLLEQVLHHNELTPREEKFIGTVWQTTWFVAQLLARLTQGLPVTELEIMTVAFAAINILVYFFWWNKPFGVGCHIRVQIESVAVATDETENNLDTHILESSFEETASLPSEPVQISLKQWVCSFWVQLRNTTITSVENIHISLYQLYGLSYTSRGHHALLAVPQAIALILFSPVATLIKAIFGRNGVFDNESGDKVPSFARTKDLEPSTNQDEYTAYGAAILFGAIHCSAWAFAFPSTTEQVLWRIAAVIVTCAPLAIALVMYGVPLKRISDALPEPWDDRFIFTVYGIGVIVMIAYILSRVVLIVVPFLALRDLPPAAFETVEWTSFIPHI